MSALAGLIGQVFSLIGLLVASLAGILFIVVLWKTDTLPVVAGWITTLLGLAATGLDGFLDVLKLLVGGLFAPTTAAPPTTT